MAIHQSFLSNAGYSTLLRLRMSHLRSSLWVVLEVQYSVPLPDRQPWLAQQTQDPGPRIAQRDSDLGFHLRVSWILP